MEKKGDFETREKIENIMVSKYLGSENWFRKLVVWPCLDTR